jgi:guanylate kinase
MPASFERRPETPRGPGKLVLILGPSGVGKSAILKKLREAHPEFHFPRSATTRARRPGEGTELYHFVKDAEFDRLIEDGKLIEWAQVHGGARYGTLVEEIVPAIEIGKTVVREVDVQGFDSIRKNPLFAGDDAVYNMQSIFILPENTKQLIQRITRRAPISDEELGRRVRSMESELEYAKYCSAEVLNREGKMDETLHKVEQLIRSLG